MNSTKRMAEVAAKLRETSFYDMPASAKGRNNFTGGLFAHSVEVWNNLESITSAMNIIWQDPSSPFIIAMLHDIGNICMYHYNHDYKVWERNSNAVDLHYPLQIAEELGIELTDEEKACITGDLSSPYHTVFCTRLAERLSTQKDTPKEEPIRCCLCGEPLRNGEFGHNPAPLMGEGVCCDHCNFHRVIPARLEDKKYEE